MTTRPASMQVRVGKAATALSGELHNRITRIVVDCDLRLPAMFEVTLLDTDHKTLTMGGLDIGSVLEIWASKTGSPGLHQLISGEITSLEGNYDRLRSTMLVVRGYDKAHRLQRARHTRTFLKSTDSSIAQKIAEGAGLTPGTIEETTPVHEHIGQMDQSDWEFLTWRAQEIGYSVGMSDGKFFFRKNSSLSTGAPLTLTFQQDLLRFRPRITAGNLTPDVEVRVWDPIEGKVISEKAEASTDAFSGNDAHTLGEDFAGAGIGAPPEPQSGTQNLGPAPSATAYVVVNRQVAVGAQIASAAKPVAQGVADHLASSFAEAEGTIRGDPSLTAGRAVKISGGPAQFAGTWSVTGARHIMDAREGGYYTEFRISGQQNRSLLALTGHSADSSNGRRGGMMCGVVSDVADPRNLGRVKVALPLLAPDFVTDWAPVIQAGAGRRSGALFLPEVGDQVLIGFEMQDPRRPYVLGGIVFAQSTYLPSDALAKVGESARVVQRGFFSPNGNSLVFADNVPPSGKALESGIHLKTKEGDTAVDIDAMTGALTVTASNEQSGKVTIQCSGPEGITISTGEGIPISIQSAGKLSLGGSEIEIQSKGTLSIKGLEIGLN